MKADSGNLHKDDAIIVRWSSLENYPDFYAALIRNVKTESTLPTYLVTYHKPINVK